MRSDMVPKRSSGFFTEDMDGETLLYRLGAHKAIYLNESAALIWKLCDGNRNVEEIVALLKAEYPQVDLTADVNESIEMLLAEGALLATQSTPTEP